MSVAPLSVVVCGGSIGGLAAAVALHRLGARVRVYESSSSSLEQRGSSIGYCNVGLWEALRGEKMIRRGTQAQRSQGAFFYGDLWRFLAAGLPAGTIRYNATIADLGEAPLTRPSVDGEAFDLAVIADGGWSALREKYFEKRLPEYAGWQAWRFRVDMEHVPGFSAMGEYVQGNMFTILLDVAKDDGQTILAGGTGVAADERNVIRPSKGANRQVSDPVPREDDTAITAAFLDVFRNAFGQKKEVMRAMEAAARHGKITPNPQYEYCANSVVKGRMVLVGDAAHMAVPRTAAGAHTAVMDGYALLEAFSPVMMEERDKLLPDWGSVVDRALAAYGPAGLNRAKDLYARSLEVSKPVCAPGWMRENGAQDL